MTRTKIHFVIDKSIKDRAFQKKIFKKNKNYNLKYCNVIIVIGGDGFMLNTLKKYYVYKKPFYGMNKGTFGFLMNKFNIENIEKRISKANLISISALEMHSVSKNNIKKKAIAINEISLLRQSKQAASLQILNKKKILIKKLICDGVLICSPAGSTAYNLSVHGPILSLNSKKLAVTPISPFRPRRWKGKIISDTSFIKVKNLNLKKRPISVVADNVEVRNIKSVIVRVNNLIKFKLLYDKNRSLIKKIKLEQLKKETV
jgi:NAD+ kinase